MPDALTTLTDPVVLFFALGLLAGAVRSNLEIPPAVSKFLSLYLLMAIGFKGGQALSHSGLTGDALRAMGLAVVLAVAIPLIGYRVLRLGTDRFHAAAIAATYGSVSAVTFVAGTQYVTSQGAAPGGHMAVALVLMESPAVLMAVALARWARSQASAPVAVPVGAGAGIPVGPGDAHGEPQGLGGILRSAFTEGTFVLLVGSLVVGAASGAKGGETMAPLTVDLFKGLLAFFLLDLGIVVARQLREVRGIPLFLVGFAVGMPLVGAALALALGLVARLPLGDLTMLMVLAASGSYIVVPAVVRYAIPEALPSRYLTMALGITFPLNIVLGIPLYYGVAHALVG
ncbi:sodium-dependent bicarbonate transport family permease [Nocardioides sp. TRM66260-LWL]|uniref:sodium-dependent bicarbonate transport family permease n=1 Tax=Nocardioides sp. TRM66260-LWL TaxID=2874478 RepID=UPI001CC6A73D|nr:sodium-dependent bicarbonate transport family permease [Nocardioides sp. TRM66260-LWL]MBZ5736138.1 sodium-dependent bicarbonate transport family permease [Nocardioides sp. TRM66260-LWL]